MRKTEEQKKLLRRAGLKPWLYTILSDGTYYIIVKHRLTCKIRSVPK